jgi:GntR family transcriptional regulator/MocR family aminotransferase
MQTTSQRVSKRRRPAGTGSPEALVQLDRSRPRALRTQVETAVREAVRSGRLTPGTRLPSSRALAADLGVTRGVVVHAYDQLCAEGYLESRPGSGTRVSSQAGAGHRRGSDGRRAEEPAKRPPRYDFRPGMPDLGLVPRHAWLRVLRDAFSELPDAQFGYGDARGMATLRTSLAAYLGRVRGVIADPDRIVVCNGFSHGLALAGRALQQAGVEKIAVEDPGHPGQREVIDGAGLRAVPCPVDGEGLDVRTLGDLDTGAVLVSPAHQFPTGAVLSPGRRTALARWARQRSGYVIEDDYDAEYRYDRYPVGALQGVAPDHVIYAGTLSKSLAPGFRLGWLVLPPPLVDPVVALRLATDLQTNAPMQAALELFVSRGDLDRHLRRTRRTYAQRRDAMVAALVRRLPDATLEGVAAGLHLVARLPRGLDEDELTDAADRHDVAVYPMSLYRSAHAAYPGAALVLGYGGLTADALDAGVARLAVAWRSLRPRRLPS